MFHQAAINFKKEREGSKKIAIHGTVGVEQLEYLKNKIMERLQYFHMLSKSEQLDFMLFILKGYLDSDANNSSQNNVNQNGFQQNNVNQSYSNNNFNDFNEFE